MVYLFAHGAYFKCSYENYRQMIRLLAAGVQFLYLDFAEACDLPPVGTIAFDIGSMTRDEAQAVIGGF